MMALAIMGLNSANSIRAADHYVPANYPTIQAAVNAAASGDTIHIAPGIYVEQTWITNKNLTLIGQPGTILRAFPGMQPGLPGVVDWGCIIFISESSNVIVRNLTFEGDQLADQNNVGLRGVNFDVSGGAVENCRFTGFREATPGSKFGKAIHFFNGLLGAALLQARVINTVIEDSYSGLAIHGSPGATSYEVSVFDNTIAGVGLTTTADALQGLRLGAGTVGKVARNTVRGFAYDGPLGPGIHPIPFGILRISSGNPRLALEPMTFEDNVLRENQVHMASFHSDDSVIRNNAFDENLPFTSEPPPPLDTAVGLWFSGENVQVTGNQFRDLEQGIRLGGGDPYPFGIPTNATLIDNRFCDVATQVYSEPGASYSEQGTLTCPFPDPVLNIAKSVLLSWPEIEEGFVVEWAPTPGGPWTNVAATYFLQDGSHAVSVPTDGEQQFYRLVKP